MPKEPSGDAQGCVGERERTSRPTSKNAKAKCNNAALLASRSRANTEQETNGREPRNDSRCSEKDSGYSDTASDSLQTDADDQQSTVNEPQPGQSGREQILPSSLSWGGGATGSQGPTHVLLLQEPGINQSASLQMLKPQPQRTESKGGKKSKSTYLPILNSYPRIAPHPNKKTPENTLTSRESNTEEHSLSKRVCTEEKREEVSTTMQAPKQHLHKQQECSTLLSSHSFSQSFSTSCEKLSACHQLRSMCHPSSPSTSLSVSSPSVSSTQTPSPPSFSDLTLPLNQTNKESHKNGPGLVGHSGKNGKILNGTARHQRFLNTVEILSQSGLLDITLRTQDLLRQNATTERDIAQLRQHAQMLCQAAQVGADAPAVWEKLHQVMADSRHYPNLKCLCTDNSDGREWSQSKAEEEAATSTKRDIPFIHRYGLNGTEELAPPSPLLAPMPDAKCQSTDDSTVTPEQSRGHRGTASSTGEPKMPPDSSTHEKLH